MKPRPVNVTREFGESQTPTQGWPADKLGLNTNVDVDANAAVDLFDDPEDKTPVAPAPSLAMLAHAGAPWYLRHRYPLVAGAGMLLILTAFAMGRTSSRVTPVEPGPVPVAPVSAGAPPAPVATPPVETIVLSVAVSPANAHVVIDGQLMPSNPFLTRYPRSTTTHRLRAVAPGFESKERWVTFSDNVMLDISLAPIQVLESPWVRDRERVRGRESSAARRHAAQASVPAAVVPGSPPSEIVPRPDDDKSRRRRIEVSDPYAKDQ
jgi:hypothetical protein